MERETDVKEQLKYSEEENRNARKKLAQLEQENEVLIMQVQNMTKGGSSTGDHMTTEEMKVQLDIQEKEILVARRRVEELDQKNDGTRLVRVDEKFTFHFLPVISMYNATLQSFQRCSEKLRASKKN